ncbi:ABC-three component system middle component 1 [Priestia aryabhattai]|uniref:ABC-three component system middle component 1 n=1 Tax=Priestia aryabhattai TaxID=412384 RepID=UPI000C06F88D|nr:ABC-three component system middle component 1 [Priestia aryabhattai]
MIEHVTKLLDKQNELTRLDSIKIRYIDSVFVSSSQIIAVASEFENEEELIKGWNRASRQLAFRIQNNIPMEFDELRWDMYLVLCVKQTNIDALVSKQIENNQYYFRKIIICECDLGVLRERIPLQLDSQFYSQEQTLLFENDVFFKKLKEAIELTDAEDIIPDTFFRRGFSTSQELKQLLNEIVVDGGDL